MESQSHEQGPVRGYAIENHQSYHSACRWYVKSQGSKIWTNRVLAHYGDEVYDFLSASFDDPSATIVYPYVYRILNSSSRAATDIPTRSNNSPSESISRPYSAASSRPISPTGSSANQQQSSPSHRTSPSVSSHNGFSPPVEEPDPEAQLITIINHISSETTGAMHKEGITELHQFLKNYPHKRPRVEKLLETTGPEFRKYINRALASRAAEDMERTAAVASTLSSMFPHFSFEFHAYGVH